MQNIPDLHILYTEKGGTPYQHRPIDENVSKN
jgi:hypothetical protein